MLNKIKKILVILLAIMLVLLAIICYFAFIKYNFKEQQKLKENLQNEISSRTVKEIPEEFKKMEFYSTEDGVEVFEEVVFDGLTFDELSKKLDKSLTSDLTGTGNLFAKYAVEYNVDPYLVVGISLLETGCKWGCSYLTRECNNVGGMKGTPGCYGGSFRAFDSLEEGIEEFIANISLNYYKKGLNTPELMEKKYAGGSTTWAGKVNNYIESIKSK